MVNTKELYDKVSSVPEEYTKKITGGRLAGMTDIKPQWRIQVMTETYGLCGIGWKVANVSFSYKQGCDDQVVVSCQLDLFVKVNGEWSEAIHGVGGNMLTTKERSGLYTSDEAEKMAYTDALSVAMKMIGVGADIYMGKGNRSKYDSQAQTDGTDTKPPSAPDDKKWLNQGTSEFIGATTFLKGGGSIDKIKEKYKISKQVESILIASVQSK
jgi:hypothetical protein